MCVMTIYHPWSMCAHEAKKKNKNKNKITWIMRSMTYIEDPNNICSLKLESLYLVIGDFFMILRLLKNVVFK